MSVVKAAALEALGRDIQANTGLDIIHVLSMQPVKLGASPCLVIQPVPGASGGWKFEPADEDEIGSGAPFTNQNLVQVGSFEGMIELTVTAATAAERENIEELVLHYFLQREGSPGVAVCVTDPVTVGQWLTLHEATCAFVLDRAEWDETEAFDLRRKSRMLVTACIPALVLRTGVYTIDSLVLALTEDLGSNIPVEQILVNEDGSVSQYP